MSELKVTSKKYNDRDVLEVDNLGEAVNEEIEAGKIAGGTKLYKHTLTYPVEHVGNRTFSVVSTTDKFTITDGSISGNDLESILNPFKINSISDEGVINLIGIEEEAGWPSYTRKIVTYIRSTKETHDILSDEVTPL